MVRRNKLSIFVSSAKEDLIDDRVIAKKSIQHFGFNAVMFEDWGARTESIKETYIDEVINSDVYIGIFNRKFSSATKREYLEAKRKGLDILIYIKKVKRKNMRDKKLRDFLDKLKSPASGHVCVSYDDVCQLEDLIKKDLSYLMSIRFYKIPEKDIDEVSITKNEMSLSMEVLSSYGFFIKNTSEGYPPRYSLKEELIEKFAVEIADTIEKYYDIEPPYTYENIQHIFIVSIAALILEKFGELPEEILYIYLMTIYASLEVSKKDKSKDLTTVIMNALNKINKK